MSGFYRPPPPKTASKASTSTLCQKCLKRDIYECKTGAQARPYIARPSRTQQLLNPDLVPKLSSDTPNDLERKTGVADEILAAQARGRKRSTSMDRDDIASPRKRSRSADSSDSISTISTNRSRTHSPRRPREDEYMTSQAEGPAPRNGNGKRRRSPSYISVSEESDHEDRNTRRRRNVKSPERRGRGRERSSSSADHRIRGRYTPSRSITPGKPRRRLSPSYVPEQELKVREREKSRSPYRGSGRKKEDNRDWKNRRDDKQTNWQRESSPKRETRPVRERSLSPFSKRLALTHAMAGRR
ncbi:hypothetical protein BT63DRAFT_451253 [Microthyrium microscopicum]|uniref:Uncharacterized protein n=1 Tax=Microthyrium microscopicum TaxID=703497 RepID=A0A6A6UN62_9PEZI|nr:hypothetical protein BT63DRAFT_451253 [Microthyrium microscopicum]